MSAICLAAICGGGWWFAPREYTGRLAYTPRQFGIPEDPPPVATLLLPEGRVYELDVPKSLRGGLKGLDGKTVRVRGRLHVRRVGALERDFIAVVELLLAV